MKSWIRLQEKKRSVNVILRGGLGNQLFQYAAGFALSQRLGCWLRIESEWTLSRDKEYRREYMLDFLISEDQKLKKHEIWPYLLYKCLSKLSVFSSKAIISVPKGVVISESFFLDRQLLKKGEFAGDVWLNGYWQDEEYFQDHAEHIFTKIDAMLPEYRFAYSPLFDDLCVGVRMYEEVKDESSKFHQGRDASVRFLLAGIQSHLVAKPNARIFIFSTLDRVKLSSLGFSNSYIYCTPESGFEDPIAVISLMSHFSHHLHMPSTLYWWASWLAMKRSRGGASICMSSRLPQLRTPVSWRIG